MTRQRVITIFATLMLAAIIGVGTTFFSSEDASAKANLQTFDYLVASGILTGLCGPPGGTAPACPAIATAPNGDSIEIVGGGTLSIHGKSVTGGGTFTHNFAAGGSASGTWTATELLSFKSYGPNVPTFPSIFESGRAVIRVHLVGPGGAEADGILQVGCLLGGPKEPGGLFEGVRLNVPGIANFNDDQFGATLFIRTN